MPDRKVLTYRGKRGHALVDTEDVTEELERVLHDIRQAENGCNIDDDGPCKQCAMKARKGLERILEGGVE